MPVVIIPPLLQHLTHGEERVVVPGQTVGDIVAALETRFPGIASRLVEHGALKAGLAVVVDSQMSRRGLTEVVGDGSEVHFIAALAGG